MLDGFFFFHFALFSLRLILLDITSFDVFKIVNLNIKYYMTYVKLALISQMLTIWIQTFNSLEFCATYLLFLKIFFHEETLIYL